MDVLYVGGGLDVGIDLWRLWVMLSHVSIYSQMSTNGYALHEWEVLMINTAFIDYVDGAKRKKK